MSREAVPILNHCIRVGTDRGNGNGVSAVQMTLQWTAGMRKKRPFADADFREQRAGVPDIPHGLADRGEDRLQQRPGIVGRACLAPQTGEVVRGAQFEHARFLTSGRLDGVEETGFRLCPVRLRLLQCDLPVNAMQIGEPVMLPRALDVANLRHSSWRRSELTCGCLNPLPARVVNFVAPLP